jgi:hypothetical protein
MKTPEEILAYIQEVNKILSVSLIIEIIAFVLFVFVWLYFIFFN